MGMIHETRELRATGYEDYMCRDQDTPFFFIVLSPLHPNPPHLLLDCTCADSPVPYEAMFNLALKAVR